MKKVKILFILGICVALVCPSTVMANDAPISTSVKTNETVSFEEMENIENIFNDSFFKSATYYEDDEGNLIFESSNISPKSLLSSQNYTIEKVKDTLAFCNLTPEEKQLIKSDVQKLKNSVSTKSSGGSNYVYEWDKSQYVKGFLRVYYSNSTVSNLPFIELTKVQGGFSGGGTGGAVVGSGVSVKSQEVTLVQEGKPYNKRYREQWKTYTKSKSSRNWTQTPPTTWLPVQSNTSNVIVGARLSMSIGRGGDVWNLSFSNHVIET